MDLDELAAVQGPEFDFLDPEPAAAPSVDDSEALPNVSIESLFDRYRSTVLVTAAQFDAVFKTHAQHVTEGERTLETLVALSRATMADSTMGMKLDDARARAIHARTNESESTKELQILVRLLKANMELLLCNEIYNHLARGPQDAPYRAAQAIEPVEIGFAADNPALPARTGPYVTPVRPRIF